MPLIEINALKNTFRRLDRALKKSSRQIAYFMINLNRCFTCNNKRKRQRRSQYRVKAYIKAVKNRR